MQNLQPHLEVCHFATAGMTPVLSMEQGCVQKLEMGPKTQSARNQGAAGANSTSPFRQYTMDDV
jgi:hypothetical protein